MAIAKGENEEAKNDNQVEQLVDNMTLLDDELMSKVFDGNIPAAELVLRIVLEDNELEVISVIAQSDFKNPLVGGRNIRLDILVKDRRGRHHNIEVQRSNDGANERRARFHSSMLDSRMLKEGKNFKELKDSYVVFITEKDYFGRGLPFYTVNRNIEELKKGFRDGSHIIYVNGSYRGDDPIGRLMRDFACKDADDMHYPELANSVRHFKEEGGRENMSEAVERYAEERAKEAAKKAAKKAAIKATIEDAVSYGMNKTQIVMKVCDKYKMSEAKAVELYCRYAGN